MNEKNRKPEATLIFRWKAKTDDERGIEELEKRVGKLTVALNSENINFIVTVSQSRCTAEFAILRSGKRWGDIQALVNNIEVPVYRMQNITFMFEPLFVNQPCYPNARRTGTIKPVFTYMMVS